MKRSLLVGCCLLFAGVTAARGDDPGHDDPGDTDTSTGDRMLEDYFEQQVSEIEASTFAGIETLADWQSRRGEYRRQLAEMLGLDPLPEKTPLQPVVTGTLDHDEFTVEKLHFQSSPGLYVTGNLYIPKGLTEPAPTILYVCGHARVKEGDVSYGNKVAYQHHAIWFARHGYVCLIIDTLQLGEIEGIHHGTYREGMWWWQSRGYTSAGVEAWNCIRALDYLETRSEVDASRFGVTGRSGGGAYSWWIAALDERIKVAVPVAGICSLRNHLLGPYQTSPWSRRETNGHDGCIEGHCDCMFFINTYRWDFPMVAALVAPRPLLISNTDKDLIFPLDGVYDVYAKAQHIYDLYDATDKLGLQICEGPHKDTQQLRVHAFQWFNKYLKGEEPLIDIPAEKLFEPEQLRVFTELPADQRNTNIHDTFVPAADQPSLPESEMEWQTLRDEWMHALKDSVLRGWPADADAPPLDIEQIATTTSDGLRLTTGLYSSDDSNRLGLLLVAAEGVNAAELKEIILVVLDEDTWEETAGRIRGWFPQFLPDQDIEPIPTAEESRERLRQFLPKTTGIVALLPRGIGPTAWTSNEKERTQIKRRFALLGQTLDGQRAWDVRRGLMATEQLTDGNSIEIEARASGAAASWLLAASLFDPSITELRLRNPEPAVFLNVRRVLPKLALPLLAADRASVRISVNDPAEWKFAEQMAAQPWIGGTLKVESVKTD